MEVLASWATATSSASCCQRRSRPSRASVVVVSAGDCHSLARTADGALFAWGQGERGCLGHGEDLSKQLLPKKVAAWAPGQ